MEGESGFSELSGCPLLRGVCYAGSTVVHTENLLYMCALDLEPSLCLGGLLLKLLGVNLEAK